MMWIKNGDINSRFYHSYARFREKSNSILELVDDDGSLITSEEGLQRICRNYFYNLFNPSSAQISNTFDQNLDMFKTVDHI